MMKSEGDTGMNGDSDIQFIDMWGPFLIKVTLMQVIILLFIVYYVLSRHFSQ